MEPFTIIAIVVAVLAVAAAVWTGARLRGLRREVASSLETMGVVQVDDTDYALHRGVRDLIARVETAEGESRGLETALASTALGVLIVDTDGRIVFANPAARGIFEGEAGESAARRRLTGFISRVTERGEPDELEFDVYEPTRRYMRLRAVPLPESAGRGRAAVVYIRDLSGQRRVEAMRRDFVINAGHELKTPIGAMAVLAETIADAEDPEIRQRLAERLQSEANRMARLVDDILALANVESLDTPFEAVAIGPVVEEAVRRVALPASERNVRIETSGTDTDAVVEGDRTQLTSAITNLVEKAVKYSLPDRDPVIDVGIVIDGDSATIAVTDHGIGIASEHLDRVFERFYRIQPGRDRESGGTGLGLSIVRNVAESHGGSVWAESVPAEGSTFTLRLPIVRT